MALFILGAAGYLMLKTYTPKATIQQKREDRSYWGQPNPPSLYQRLNNNNLLDRTASIIPSQRVKGSVFDRSLTGATLFSTVEQNGVDAVTPQSNADIQSNVNDMLFEDMPFEGYNTAGAKHNWHIDARARGRPKMSSGVSRLEIPSAADAETGIGEWPVAGMERQGAIFGFGTRAAPRELYRQGPINPNGRPFHQRLIRGGDHRPYHSEQDDH